MNPNKNYYEIKCGIATIRMEAEDMRPLDMAQSAIITYVHSQLLGAPGYIELLDCELEAWGYMPIFPALISTMGFTRYVATFLELGYKDDLKLGRKHLIEELREEGCLVQKRKISGFDFLIVKEFDDNGESYGYQARTANGYVIASGLCSVADAIRAAEWFEKGRLDKIETL